ncbi:N-acyl-D-amino-acid deacylase family protein [Rhodohalobacter sp.]|uniref:N-acyl-D-amino-acid deacylase family protein n=1 Tax=Rhodohalobacter sp. TaxID=1974210 RepID=UPI002ACD9953|nr:amidohydrolase family protein [Rhodohalobacter sp.]MDZ7755631.1 amidohydrolase family protein [Rhodohalobacter sp.]
MSIRYLILYLLLLFLNFTTTACNPIDQSGDITIITNAIIIDGTAGDRFDGDLLIRNGIIEQIGTVEAERYENATVIDADGRVVAPGFIDLHSHGNPLDTPEFNNFLSMGVTTISLGQDGGSVAVEDVSDWMRRVDEAGTGTNILHFKGHGTLRQLTNAPQDPDLPESNLKEMIDLLRSSMEAGSFGMTTGLEYEFGRYTTMDELVALAEVVAEYDGVVMSHVRNEDDDQIEDSIRELIEQGEKSGSKVHVSHIKIVYGNEPSRAEDVLQLLNDARERGVNITADVYPYAASFTGIGIVFPDWATEGDYDQIVADRRDELAEYLKNRVNMRNGPEATLFGTAPWAGMTLAEVADSLNKPFEDVLIDDIGPRGASAAYFVMNENVMRRFLQDPYVMVSSDGSPTMRHPRGYGSFAKIIRKYVVEEELLTLEEAVHKMSGQSAELLGLSDPDKVETLRGMLKEGFAADLVIFDPQNVRDTADFENPHQPAEGFDWVLVNGVTVIENGERNESLPAGVIRRR